MLIAKKFGFHQETHIRNDEKEPVLFWHLKGTLQVLLQMSQEVDILCYFGLKRSSKWL